MPQQAIASSPTRAVAAFFALLIACLWTASCFAQETSGKEHPEIAYWIAGGTGISSTGFLSGSVSLSLQRGESILSLRGTSNGEVFFGDELSEIGILYGPSVQSEKNFLSCGMGVSLIAGSRFRLPRNGTFNVFHPLPDSDVHVTVGLPIELQAFWRPLTHFGIGLYGYADINSEKLLAGLTLCLQAGKFR